MNLTSRPDGKRYLVFSGPVGFGPPPWQIVGHQMLRRLYQLPKDQCIFVPWDEGHRERVLAGLNREGLIELGVREDGRYREIAEELRVQREQEDGLHAAIEGGLREAAARWFYQVAPAGPTIGEAMLTFDSDPDGEKGFRRSVDG